MIPTFQGVFGTQQQPATHKVFGDFKELKDNPDPAFYIHMIEKPLRNPGAWNGYGRCQAQKLLTSVGSKEETNVWQKLVCQENTVANKLTPNFSKNYLFLMLYHLS